MAGVQRKKKDVVKILKKNGYIYVRTHGSHAIYKRGDSTIVVTSNPNAMMWQRLIKENNLIL